MCGFVGACGLESRPTPEMARDLTSLIRHRGPDTGSEFWRDGVWLGFRRLAILDLHDRADQPMVDEKSGTALVMNGEIYNYLELRSTLEDLGHDFGTTGDTEVFLRGFIQWGVDLFPRCEGMFAAAIRRPDGDVILSRDRFGEKPLYFGRNRRSWWFGSEPAVVRAAGAGSARINPSRVLGFLGLGDIEDPGESYFDGISQVSAGTYLLIDSAGSMTSRRWFDVREMLARSWDAGAVEPAEVLSALDAAVRLRLRSDVPVGTSLSGGLDSSGVVSSLRAVDPDRELHAFTASFPGSAVDEWANAESVATAHGVTLHRVAPEPAEFVDSIPALVRAQGAPFDSPSVYAQWCVMRGARDVGVTVLLDGQGADETWGGYPKHAGLSLAGSTVAFRPDLAWRGAMSWKRFGPVPRPPWAQGAGLLAPVRSRQTLAATFGRRIAGPALATGRADDPFGPLVAGDVLRRVAAFDLQRGLLPRLLRFADRNSMAWSREIRLPYLDTKMVELGLRSNWSAGLRAGWTKLALRRSLASRLPEGIVWRRDKIAYQAPDQLWLQRHDIQEAVKGATAALVARGILRPAAGPKVSPWRRLSLATFIEENGLSA